MQLADIEAHLQSTAELGQIIGAMRSLASMRVQQALHTLESVRRYGETTERAARQALLLAADEAVARTRSASARALVVCMSEQGFVGAFNDRIIQAVEATLDGADRLLVLGSRGAALARERGQRMDWSHAMATRLTSIPEMIRRLLAELYPLIAAGRVARAEVIFARQPPGAELRIEQRPLFPLPLAEPAARTPPPLEAPLHTLASPLLLEKLTAEYLFALLVEAATESVASENSARLTAMAAAHDNVMRKLEQLQRQAAQARQELTTMELLDLLTGEKAVRDR